MITTILLMTLGLVVGMLGVLLGIGGGIVIVPALAFFFDVPIHGAIAISLMVIMGTSLSTSAVFIKSGQANLHVGLFLATSSVLGAILGSYISLSLSPESVMLLLGVVQIFVAYLVYVRTKTVKSYIPADVDEPTFFDGKFTDQATNQVVHYKPIRMGINWFFSLLSGVYSGLAGVGGGILVIPGMNLISNMPIKAATATSAFLIGFTSSAGAIVYLVNGYIQYDYTAYIFIGIVVGTWVAVRFFKKITDKKVSYLFIAILLIVSARMIYGAITNW